MRLRGRRARTCTVTKVYLSSSFAARGKTSERAARLDALGYTITSSWLREPVIEHDDQHEDWLKRARANDDVEDVRRSDAVVIFTGIDSTSGGLHVELGLAIANHKRIYVVGPLLNVFMYRNDVTHYQDWATLLNELREGACL